MYDSLQRGTVQSFSFALFIHRISSVSTEQWRIGVTNCVRGVELATRPNFAFLAESLVQDVRFPSTAVSCVSMETVERSRMQKDQRCSVMTW